MEAQQIITMSINKITGSRGQRGGVNLRKNLLVATVLHSARAMYYEEMCNRMARNAELRSRERDTIVDEEDDDCTEAPDWGDSNNSEESSSCQRMEAEATELPTEDKENCRPVPTNASSVQARLEKPHTDSTSSPMVADQKQEESSPDIDRMVLGQLNTNSPPTGCNACKRKRSESADELREACESILPKRAKSSDSECQTEELTSSASTPSAKQNSEGSITSLVSIFKSGFHGLSGEANPSGKTTNIGSSNHLQQSSYASSMPRPFEQLQMPIAAC
ncbi:immediate early response gene 2 protein-like [Acanthaster planci]|uniref:Immediate early response gene 2 protein-like n=1 Tax=Acanthaster planci TaxID=133434 RepID=A0A8B7Z0J0_ACAPL|nr:immediate early response gene 2 protein-like [Acanthaster planci]